MAVEEKELDEQIKEDVDSSEANMADAEAADPAEDAAAETQDSDASEENAGTGDKKEKKKSFLGKEKKEKANKLQKKVDELEDRVKRQMAEFDNFRKRTEKEKTQMYDMGARSIVEKILPVIDNFERGLAGVSEEQKEDAFVVGMDKIYRQMLTELETIGVTPIEALGKEFDPEYHNAVMQVESEEFESGVVAQELQKGYMYKDSVVRHSMVAVVS